MKDVVNKSKETKSNTQIQLHANRANAKKSTGPRTPDGKRRSSGSAVKHGLLSTHAIITEGGARRRSVSHADAPESDSDHAKTTCFFCETNPFFPPGAIENGVRAQKTNPIEPISDSLERIPVAPKPKRTQAVSRFPSRRVVATSWCEKGFVHQRWLRDGLPEALSCPTRQTNHRSGFAPLPVRISFTRFQSFGSLRMNFVRCAVESPRCLAVSRTRVSYAASRSRTSETIG